MINLFAKLLGDPNEKEIKKIWPTVEKVNVLEDTVRQLSDNELKLKTKEFSQRHSEGESLDSILPEVYAVVREAAYRVTGMRPFDVQVLGGIVLHQGRIAEMKTGEGKTLVATMPAYLNALTGKGVHIVTVNDYLARRDSEWMGRIYEFLGLSVGLIVHGLTPEERQKAYNCDIIYGTNNEFGFDYLRDNMVIYSKNLVQRPLNYAIIDEVDSILIDEARTPLIISGHGQEAKNLYSLFAGFTSRLKKDVDYTVDEKAHSVVPTEEGIAKVEKFLSLGNINDEENIEYYHHLIQSLKAHALMKRDRDYVVKNGEILIVDEFTGRLMIGRRYSDGLHQAIEAKEGVKVKKENQTLASITYQNYFRMYSKLAGMTGTAATEEEEFIKIYGMDVVVVPTNKPMIRDDLADVIYKSEAGKFRAVIEEIEYRHNSNQPVLVGTISIEKSELLSKMLKKKGIPHQVLNAKHHEQEAEIISRAGMQGSVTIATNMAGRGTDIVLGDGIADIGGLHILGTERHESRRIDNQLRGRSGRQGDPGSSQFFISLEDDLMRLFGSDSISSVMERLGFEEDQPITNNVITKAIENAQKRVEARNFDIRKHVLEYDDVLNKQRQVIYAQRRQVLEGANLKDTIVSMIKDTITNALDTYAPEKLYMDDWDLEGLLAYGKRTFLLPEDPLTPEELNEKERDELQQIIVDRSLSAYQSREEELGDEMIREMERVVLLRIVDQKWMHHIDAMHDLRQGIGLRAFGNRNPLTEYKHEAFQMFEEMIGSIQDDVIRWILRVKVTDAPRRQKVAIAADARKPGDSSAKKPVKVNKVGRNDPCPCGSGKKYKKCCGK